MIRSMDANYGNIRSDQPNYKRKLQDFFENKLKEDPTFEDHDSHSEFHLTIIRNDLEKFEEIIAMPDFAKNDLNLRNAEGQSPLYIIIKLRRDEMFNTLFEQFKD
jgi:HSP20 family molecular chaperone IbpA